MPAEAAPATSSTGQRRKLANDQGMSAQAIAVTMPHHIMTTRLLMMSASQPIGKRRTELPMMKAVSAGEATSLSIPDRKSTRLNSSHITISYAVFCLKKKKNINDKIKINNNIINILIYRSTVISQNVRCNEIKKLTNSHRIYTTTRQHRLSDDQGVVA